MCLLKAFIAKAYGRIGVFPEPEAELPGYVVGFVFQDDLKAVILLEDGSFTMRTPEQIRVERPLRVQRGRTRHPVDH